MSKVYIYKHKLQCCDCGINAGLVVVEEQGLAHADECQLLTICIDCLTNREDYQRERGE